MNRLRRLFPILYRIFPATQEARCSTCGTPLRERRRKPCPVCTSTQRTITRGMEMAVRVDDRMG